MMTLWQTPAIVLMIVTWFTSPPVSLADAAQREALRRSLMPKSTGSYSNENLRPDLNPVPIVADPVVTGEVGAVAATTDPATAASATPPAGAEPVKLAVQDEKAWRAKIAEARATLDRNSGLVEAMQTRVNSLQNDAINRDDPAQQAALRQALQKALSELERLKAQVIADQKAIASIQADARRLGVPPGWVR
jgi:hypothetical protein